MDFLIQEAITGIKNCSKTHPEQVWNIQISGEWSYFIEQKNHESNANP